MYSKTCLFLFQKRQEEIWLRMPACVRLKSHFRGRFTTAYRRSPADISFQINTAFVYHLYLFNYSLSLINFFLSEFWHSFWLFLLFFCSIHIIITIYVFYLLLIVFCPVMIMMCDAFFLTVLTGWHHKQSAAVWSPSCLEWLKTAWSRKQQRQQQQQQQLLYLIFHCSIPHFVYLIC